MGDWWADDYPEVEEQCGIILGPHPRHYWMTTNEEYDFTCPGIEELE